ncbi:MAG TPA: hypothetical protein VKT30_01315 [Caulobacteraceae bacterium]|nr:hypothetical protein [Caulobacteraceae bacterium]
MDEAATSLCKPRACLRVGVTGHRTGPKLLAHLQPAVRATVDRLLREIAASLRATSQAASWAFAAEGPQLVVVSSLAEGADRIVAEAGLAAGAALDVVLPAPRASYAQDFESKASKAEFDGLLAKARTVFELEDREGDLAAKRGYQASGLTMLANADLIIAIWDEGEAGGIGGTAEIVEQAYAEGAPILLINPAAPDAAHLLWTGAMELPPANVRLEDAERTDPFADLPAVVSALVAPDSDQTSTARLLDFYTEPPGPEHGWPLYSMLLAVLAVRPLQWTDFRPSDEHAFEPRPWRRWFSNPADPLTAAVCDVLLPAITLPDRLAVRYAELYRSAFVFIFLTSALVVITALTGLVTELDPVHRVVGAPGGMTVKAVLVATEIALLSAILFVIRQGAQRGWHRRWLDYRRTAEWLRYLRALSLVGARPPLLRPRRPPPEDAAVAEAGRMRTLSRLVALLRGAALAGNKPERGDWVAWYVRAIGRELPLPNTVVDETYIRRTRAVMVRFELNGQIRYHQRNSLRMSEAARRLHATGRWLFITPMIVGATFLVGYALYVGSGRKIRWAYDWRHLFTAATAAFPALGAALNAIRVQADFETVGARSDEAARRLRTIRAAMLRDRPTFALLSDRIQRAVAVMGAEHSEWRTLFGTRPLSLPA